MFNRVILAICILLAAGCRAAPPAEVPGDSLSIYLTAQPLSGAQIRAADLEDLALQAEPLLAPADILSYQRQSGEMWLSRDAAARLAQLKVPVSGLGFVACVGGEPVFAGALWTLISSRSFDGVVLEVPISPEDRTARLGLGYPGSDHLFQPDPRFLETLRQADKLR